MKIKILIVGVVVGGLATLSAFFVLSRTPLRAAETAIHPRLLFLDSEIPALQTKIEDGLARDDAAFDYIISQADLLANENNTTTLVGSTFGLNNLPILGLAYQLSADSNPNRAAYRTKCQAIMTSIRMTYSPTGVEGGVTDSVYESSMRLVVLSEGFDWCYDDVSGAARSLMVSEIESYISHATSGENQPWANDWQDKRFHPYNQNKGFMALGALGLASIVLRGETANTALLDDGLALADEILSVNLSGLLQDDGAYDEGVLYASWSMRFLIPYIEARIRYDGVDYSTDPGIANVVNWLAYEVRPSTDSRVNNLNDTLYSTYPLSLHNTVMSWAQTRYNSGVAKWLYEKTGMAMDYGRQRDNVAIVLWDKDIAAVNPSTQLPQSNLFANRGLYYYRTGWPDVGQTETNDSVFSLYAGKFWGGHAQEDQGQFTLYSKYEDFVVDTGLSTTAKNTSGHNLVLIDGADQHNAGSTIGTDGSIVASLVNPFSDYIHTDLAAAYTTHSPFNDNGYPWPLSDWSWGHTGANPVVKAQRTALSIKHSEVGEYFVIYDDIIKDGGTHTYDWQLHTRPTNTINAASNPIVITGSSQGSTLSLYLANPDFNQVTVTQATFTTNNSDGDTKRLKVSAVTDNPRFFVILFPRANGLSEPTVTMTSLAFSGGRGAQLSWSNNYTDYLVHSDAQTPVTTNNISADGLMSVVRKNNLGAVTKFSLNEGSSLIVDSIAVVTVTGGMASVASDGATITVSDSTLDYIVAGQGINSVFDASGNALAFTENNGFIYINASPPSDVAAPNAINDLIAF